MGSAATMEAPGTAARRAPRRQTPSRGLTVRVTNEGDLVTVRAVGKLDIYTIPRLRREMTRHDPESEHVVIDMSRVTLIDSSGLGTLLSFANRARRSGRRLGLVCTPELAEVLEIARLANAFEITLV
jgi:anti-anti-sigma factor